MNKVIDTMMNHRSIRSYEDAPIKDEELKAIIGAAQAAASSINGQQVSIIKVSDPEKKAQIAYLSGNQHWIDEAPMILIFAIDFYRAHLGAKKNGRELAITDYTESLLVGSIDLGLAMANATLAAESLGLGTVCIGGIRNAPDEMIKMLDLPPYVYPACGLVIGHPKDHSALKPRLPQEAVYFEETYNKDLMPLIDNYDETIKDYLEKRTGEVTGRNWTSPISGYYSYNYYPKVSSTLTEQKFKHQ